MTEGVYLGLGTNLGDRRRNLREAVERLRTIPGIHVRKESSVYRTAPQDVLDQPWFLNMALEIATELTPHQLLKAALGIEVEMGRRRVTVKGPRLIDIDILLFGLQCVESEELIIPHPGLLLRRFAMEPLVELNPEVREPSTGKKVKDLLVTVTDQQVLRL